jgi:hypothetical protein
MADHAQSVYHTNHLVVGVCKKKFQLKDLEIVKEIGWNPGFSTSQGEESSSPCVKPV